MSIFGKIMSAIFGSSASAAPAGGTATSTAPAGGSPSTSASSSSPAAAPAAAPAQTVDVAPILDAAVAAKKEKLEWRTSIVDLMKALDIDSSLGARKELAKELGYAGDTNDSASMNIWLHKQVMAKLAANGGKLPPDIKHRRDSDPDISRPAPARALFMGRQTSIDRPTTPMTDPDRRAMLTTGALALVGAAAHAVPAEAQPAPKRCFRCRP